MDLDQSARDAVPDDLEVDGTQTFSDFQPLTEDNVYALIQKSAKTYCALDPMPTLLVAKCLEVPNLSLSSVNSQENGGKL